MEQFYIVIFHGYNEENVTLETADDKILEARLDTNTQAKQASVHQSFINNYETPIDKITVVGNLVNRSSKARKSNNKELTLVSGVQATNGNAKVYYSDKENITAQDESWQDNIQNVAEVKSYKVEIEGELPSASSINVDYKLNIPDGLENGSETYQQTKATYYYNGQELESTSGILLSTQAETSTTPDGEVIDANGIKTEVVAKSANKELKDKEEIFEGQPIQYEVKVTNNTGKDLRNVTLVAEHTNAIYYVEVQEEADITDSEIPEILTYTKKDEKASNVTKTIATIKRGETYTFTYMISPKKKDGNLINGKVYLSATNVNRQEIPTITNTIKDAKLGIDIINNVDENMTIYDGETVDFKLNITNYTNVEQKNVVINMKVLDYLKILMKRYELEEEIGAEVIKIEDNNIIFKIPTINANETYSINIRCRAKDLTTKQIKANGSVYYTAELEGVTYYSNTITREVEKVTPKVAASQTVNVKDETVRVGEKVIYTAEITNNDEVLKAENMEVLHKVTEANSKIERAFLKKSNGEIIPATIEGTNEAKAKYTLEPKETVQYIAETQVWENPSESVGYQENVTSDILVTYDERGALTLNKISKTLGAGTVEEPPKEDPNKPNKPGDEQQKEYSITGTAWLDRNKDGIKDSSETGMQGLEVVAINVETGEEVTTVKTNEEGVYTFEKLKNGKYNIIFKYDSSLYSITQYRKQGIEEAKTSNVMQKEVDGQVVAITDTLTVSGANINNINAGFTQNIKFDFSLDKTITKITVQNKEGTKQVGFNKTKLAKVEVSAKHINNTNIAVEYTIDIKNEGEVEGYVNDIVDYMPKDLKFSENANSGWYMGQDGNIHNLSLTNTIIKPGETKEIKLILTKQMNEENTGRSINTAEIGVATNKLSIIDEDSTPGNRVDNEDDISTAEVLVSIRTGLLTVSITLISLVILVIIACIIYIKKKGVK